MNRFGPQLNDESRRALAERLRLGDRYQSIADDLGITTAAVSYHAKRLGLSRRDVDKPAEAERLEERHWPASFVLFDPLPWSVDALCAETDPDAFFPEKGGSTREAKAVCDQCTVAAECLTYALDHEERFGIWGGLSERERRKLRHLTPSRETGWPSTTTATTHLEEPA